MFAANHSPRWPAEYQHRRLSLNFAVLLAATLSVPAVAEESGTGGVGRASFDRSAPQAVPFSRQSPQVGDQVEQTIAMELRMTTAERRGAELLDQTQTIMRNGQRRVITTTNVADGLTTGVKLRYVAATRQIGRSGDSSEPDGMQPSPTRQPVDGKLYDCRRHGDSLIITDAQGGIPPLGEYEIVAQHMEMLGRPNPLTDFLTGQTIHVGQRVSLPNDVAERLLGLGDQLGKVTRFDLTLTGTTTEQGAACAVFQADVEAASNDSSQMRLEISGPIVIETRSCRAVRVELAGPIGMSETRGSYSTTYYLIGTGSMAVRLESLYRDVER